MSYIFYIFLGLLPSLLWLSYYLKKDRRPEPNSLVVRIFVWGMLLAPLAVVLELFLTWLIHPDSVFLPVDYLAQSSFLKIVITTAFVPALVEEYLKYAVVKAKFIKDVEFDEPTDVMIYCIIAALGFAAVENLIVLYRIQFPDFTQALTVMSFRFVGATLVHALGSALLGYWLAQGLFKSRQRSKLIVIGLTIAIAFHTCYNYLVISILQQETIVAKFSIFLLLVTLLVVGTVAVALCFKRLRKQRSVCQYK